MQFLKKTQLEKHGRRVQAQITNVVEVHGPTGGRINVNLGQNAYEITATWTDPQTNTMYTFEKKGLIDHPLPLKEGQMIPVLFNPNNPKEYIVEFE